jgi:hypothetical protein
LLLEHQLALKLPACIVKTPELMDESHSKLFFLQASELNKACRAVSPTVLLLLPCQKDFPLQHPKGKLKSNNIPHTVLLQFAIQENSQWQRIALLTLSIATSALTISP